MYLPQPSQWHGRSIGVLSIFGSAEPTILWHLLPLGNVTLFGVIPGTLSPASLGAPAGVTGVVNPPTTPSGSSGEYLLRFLSTGRRHSMPAPRNNGAVPRNRLGCQRSANEPRRDGKIVSYEDQSGFPAKPRCSLHSPFLSPDLPFPFNATLPPGATTSGRSTSTTPRRNSERTPRESGSCDPPFERDTSALGRSEPRSSGALRTK